MGAEEGKRKRGWVGEWVEVNVMRTDRSSRRKLTGYTDRHRARRSNMDQILIDCVFTLSVFSCEWYLLKHIRKCHITY